MGEEYGIQSSAEHCACVVDMLGRLGVEGNVLGRWGSLLAACRVHRNFELGKIVSNVGNWQSVDNVRRGMHKMGIVKGDKKHPRYCMKCDMLGYLTINMKDAGYRPKLELIEEWIYGLEE
ncbi:hypothetical protein KY290_007461 [Solanum tuberosum]|uniref:Pentatricopeptide repeat-containing protein n=1 Tax=Solanum tuberosum TaxID=4113 RepID=A0ABQ7W5Q6_SOLTU|nr:hypothetical protein KY290_007461 [Solanum tuberosum]